MTRFFLDPICMTLLTAESTTNGLKSRLSTIWRRKMEFRKKSNIVECIHRLLLSRFHMTFALFGLFCRFFAGFLASFQHWFKSLLFIFITGTRFENHSSIVLLKLSFDFFSWCFTDVNYMMQQLYDVESGCGELWNEL